MADVGRPTKMTADTVRILEEAFSNGASDIEACFLSNISKQTLYDYQAKHPEFIDRKEALKDSIKYQAKLVIKTAIASGDKQMATWYAERKIKDEFSPRIENTGRDGKDLIPTPIMTLDVQPNDSNQKDSEPTEED